MAEGRNLRIVLDGEGYDLSVALAHATYNDLRALWVGTQVNGKDGRNPFTITKGFDRLGELAKMPTDERMEALYGDDGMVFMDTMIDLLFLAKRQAGEQVDGKPITHRAVAGTEFFALLAAFGDAVAAASEGEAVEQVDPTTAPTDSDRGDEHPAATLTA
jgi:hypothetical protein